MYESGENYLETILILSRRLPVVRSIDVANELNFSKPSISRAMGILKSDGYIEMDRAGGLKLTPSGLEKARSVYERHRTIRKYLQCVLNVSAENAEIDACRMEHILSEETFNKIREAASNLGEGE